MEFKEFLITEQTNYFTDKVNSLLVGVQDLVSSGDQIGERKLMELAENIVGQIRKILHTSWHARYRKHLKRLQKCGVAIMKTIDEKGDLREVLDSCQSEIGKILEKLGEPVNNLGKNE